MIYRIIAILLIMASAIVTLAGQRPDGHALLAIALIAVAFLVMVIGADRERNKP